MKVGMVRFDIDEANGFEAEVSINLNPKARGQGYSAQCLRLGIHKIASSRASLKVLMASVKYDNFASRKIFGKVGFELHKELTEYEQLRLKLHDSLL